MKNITIKATQPFSVDLPFRAEPLPTLSWTFNGKDVNSDTRFSHDLGENLLKLSGKETKRSDTGKYLVKLTNAYGSDSCEVDLVVLSAPSKPKGPLEIKEVRKYVFNVIRLNIHKIIFLIASLRDHVVIGWSKPDDNGGKDVE